MCLLCTCACRLNTPSSFHLWQRSRRTATTIVALMQIIFTRSASVRELKERILIAKSIQFNAPQNAVNEWIICTHAPSVSRLLQRDFPESRRRLNEAFSPGGSKQRLSWLHDPTCPAESEATPLPATPRCTSSRMSAFLFIMPLMPVHLSLGDPYARYTENTGSLREKPRWPSTSNWSTQTPLTLRPGSPDGGLA